MIPPSTPPMPASAAGWSSEPGRYGAMAWASTGTGMDWSQMFPGPVSDTRWNPSPPK